MRIRLKTGIALWAAVLFSAIAMSQEQQLPSVNIGNQSLRVAVNLVLLDVSVSDKTGHSVKNLRQENFKVYEDKVEQPISYFSTEESPVTWGVVLDRSSSMANMKEVQEAALHMIHEGTTQDEMFVMTFSKEVETVSEITTDRVKLQNSMFGVKPKGSTALWDAAGSALDYIKKGKHRKKALVVITDGADNRSVLRFTRLLDRVRESDVLIYTVGMNTATGVFAKGRNDRSQLEQLAEVTGGYAHFPTDLEKCSEAMAEIAREVSEHYTVGYYPTNASQDGKWRKISVVVKDSSPAHPKYLARTRNGYYAPALEK
jgi:Ca-activated chloride channel family protein